MNNQCYQEFSFWLMDENYNPMPAGTEVTTANNNIYFQETKGSPSQPTLTVEGTPVINTNHAGGTRVALIVSGGASCSAPFSYPTGTVDIVTTTPSPDNITTNITVNVVNP